MNPRTQLPLNAQVSEEAAEWFVDFRAGDVSRESRVAFETWVRSSPEHLRAYLEYAALWVEGESVDARRGIDVEALIGRAQAEQPVVPLEQAGLERQFRRTRSSRGWRGMPAVAAVLVIVVAAASVLGYLRWSAPVYSTAAGEQRSISLADGSTVQLNSRSRLRVRYTDDKRSVELLAGQAWFEVVHEPARPFLVTSGPVAIRAVGTQFDVYRKKTGTTVTVVEGKVAVTGAAAVKSSDSAADGVTAARPADSAPVYVSAGEQFSLGAGASPAPVRINTAATTAWTQRRLVLKSAPLSEVAEEFNRYSTRELVVTDTAAEELRLSGVFSTNPDFLIRYLRARPDISVVETDDRIRIVHHDPR